ncbi:methyl-accepting chemotaxis protein [Thermodesulfobacteriota bacterium]
MFSRLKLGQKLLIAFLCVGVIPFSVVGLTALLKASAALEQAAFNQLNAVQGIKKAQISTFFGERHGDMNVLVATVDNFVKQAGTLDAAVANLTEGDKDYFADYIKEYGYYDLFLIDPQGKAFYTVAKEADYNSNFVNGKYANSNMGKLIRQVMQTRQYGMADFAPYAPSNNEPCSFIAAPLIMHGDVKLIIGLQLSLEAMNRIMQQRDGMGETGESYLVGSDKLMRSDSFLDPTGHSVMASFANPATGSVDTVASREALAGRSDSKIIIDYNGNPVLSSYAPMKIGDTTWAVIAEIDEAEAMAAVNALKWVIGIVFVIGVAGIITVALMITRSITQPVGKTVHMLEEMSKGHLDTRLNMDRADEIGQMAKTMDSFADSLQNEMVAALNKLADGDLTFNAIPHDENDAIRNSLKKTGDDLNVVISDILTATEQVASGSGQVSDSSQALSQGATEQAASLEEITSSMTEMGSQTKLNAENATQANQLAGQTKTAAEGGNAKMQEMVSAMGEINEAGQNISKIIKVIDEIAFQTNLLALNAAVEAARAGRHGKGFAVVAEEVRNLAARSAKAAKETAELIEGSVEKTKNGTAIAESTSAALAEIVTSVTKVSDLVGEIAAASNEQAQGINQTNQALGQIDQVTQQNTASAEESAAASEELSGQAMHMKEMMSRFRVREMNQGGMRQQVAAAPQQNNWGGTSQKPLPRAQAPSRQAKQPAAHDIIALDDKEFGKY